MSEKKCLSCGNVLETADEDLFHCEDCLKRMHSGLLKFISSWKNKRVPRNEQNVKNRIIQPILEYLGWNVKSDLYIDAEYSLVKRDGKGGIYKVDYGLLIPKFEEKLRCIIEAKAPGKLSGNLLSDAESQLLDYAYHLRVPLAFLTDGIKWRIYLPTALRDPLAFDLDVEKDSSDEIVATLEDCLSFEKISSNEAIEIVRRKLEERVAKKQISRAWEKLLVSDKLITLLIKETKQISGDTPERQYVEEFLKGLNGGGEENPEKGKGKIQRLIEFLTPLIKEGKYTRNQLQKKAEEEFRKNIARSTIDTQLWGSMKSDAKLNRFSHVVEVDSRTKVMRFTKEVPKVESENDGGSSDKEIHFFLRGKKYTEETAISAYVKIFEIFASQDGSFLEVLAPQTAGLKNQWLSRSRDDMSVYDEATELPGGWWLDKNVSNKDKNKRLEKACKIAGIVFGKPEGLKVNFPPAVKKSRNREK